MTDNLVKYLDKLTEFEKVFMFHTVNIYGGMTITLGTLPFVDRELAIKCLRSINTDVHPKEAKKARQLITKFGGDVSVSSFEMQLEDQMVLRRTTGKSMTGRIMLLNSSKVVGAGIQWNAFKRCWVKPDKMVRNQVLLSRVRPGTWKVEVDDKLTEYTKQALFAMCGDGQVKVKSEVFQRPNGSWEASSPKKGNYKQRKW